MRKPRSGSAGRSSADTETSAAAKMLPRKTSDRLLSFFFFSFSCVCHKETARRTWQNDVNCAWQLFYILNNNCRQGKMPCAPVTVQTSGCTKALLDQLHCQALQQQRSVPQLSRWAATGSEWSAGLGVTLCECNRGTLVLIKTK